MSLSQALRKFTQATGDPAAITAVREKLGEEHGLTDELLATYRTEMLKLEQQVDNWRACLDAALNAARKVLPEINSLTERSSFEKRTALQAKIEAINPTLKAGLIALEARHKGWLKLLDLAEKTLRARQWSAFEGDTAREAKKALLPRDVKKREKPTVRDQGVETFKRASYFIAQAHWLLSRFLQGLYEDVPGLCRAVTRTTISDNDYSLTPGRYVGAALGSQDDDDGEAFAGRMREIHGELVELNEKASELATSIQARFSELFE